MKRKITISLDENILETIDKNVEKWSAKNRSYFIEKLLKQTLGGFHDITVIIFAHDNKWDNRPYPFDIEKSLLEVRGKTIISRQVEIFAQTGLKNIIICIPIGSLEKFKNELLPKFKNIQFQFLELDTNIQTGRALQEALKLNHTDEKLIISNGDIFYGNLNMEEYYNYFKEQKADFSFCLKFVFFPEQLWNIKIHGNKVIEFVEKPKASEMNLTNSGLYITTRSFLNKHNFWNYLEEDFFPKLPNISNTVWYIYPWEWEHIQNDSAFERVNGELL